jgi:hypothetical protein
LAAGAAAGLRRGWRVAGVLGGGPVFGTTYRFWDQKPGLQPGVLVPKNVRDGPEDPEIAWALP